LLLLASLLPGYLGCGKRVAVENTPGPKVGVYKVRLDPPEGKARRFRVLLYAALPDRIHAEVITPLGSTALILDGGNGRLAVTFVRDDLAFVGSAEPQALAAVFGVELALDRLVAGLLTGEWSDVRYALDRVSLIDPGLPESMTISGEGQELQLRLRRLQPLRAVEATLGTGEPRPGIEQRPLSELRLHELPIDEAEIDDGRGEDSGDGAEGDPGGPGAG
jgi:hypothetical protein